MKIANKAWLALLLASLLLAPASAYMGKQLARGPVDSFTLTDQSGESYTFGTDTEGVVVVTFIFTRCPDVCPVLTQKLVEVEAEMTEEERDDVTFLSISVDPEYDSPEALKEYSERMGASWPHLTGSTEELEPVWESFGLVVQRNVIDMHVMDYQPGEASVTLVDTNNNSSQHMFQYDGWDATAFAAEQAGWSLNSSGGMIIGINGTESPDDWAWYWQLNLWNTTSEAWEASGVGMSDVDALDIPHIAWMRSDTNRSLLPQPDVDMASSVTVQWSNNSTEVVNIEQFTGYHITQGALIGAGMNTTNEIGSLGHLMTDINNQTSPPDWEWYWTLYAWNETTEAWNYSSIGQDDLVEPTHIAWAPNYTDPSAIPAPISDASEETVCNGHGWEMGSGASKHCMCDSGYTWAEDDQLSCVAEMTEEYNVGHSTITYILNADFEPTVAWTGDAWRVEDFTADVRELLEKEQLGGYEAGLIPALPFALTLSAMLAAFALAGLRRTKVNSE